MSAIISPCGRYRYRLERQLGMFGPTAVVIMVNPSTADADTDDATIRRVIGFGKRFGWSRVIVGNIFGFRATRIGDLGLSDDPVGPENHAHLRSSLSEADVALVAWGRLGKLPSRFRNEWKVVHSVAQDLKIELNCLGVTQDGHPKHPLMLSYQSVVARWEAPTN